MIYDLKQMMTETDPMVCDEIVDREALATKILSSARRIDRYGMMKLALLGADKAEKKMLKTVFKTVTGQRYSEYIDDADTAVIED